MTENWWENLTPEQMQRYGGYIDSRVRLLGEYYGRAVEAVRNDKRIRDEVLALGVSA